MQPPRPSQTFANPTQTVGAFTAAPPLATSPPDAQRPDRILRSGHSGEISAISFSPDGRWLATGSEDKSIRIWDLSTGRTLRILTGHTDLIWSLAFSPDAKRLASASQDGTLRLWDTVNWTLLYTLNSGTTPIACRFSPDGKFLIVSNQSREEEGGGASIDIRDAVTTQMVRTIRLEWGTAQPLIVTPDGRLLASGGAGEDGEIDVATKTWDLRNGRELANVSVLPLAVSPDGRWIASRVNEQDATKIIVQDAQSGKTVRSITSPDRAVSHLEFTPDSSRLLAATGIGPVSGMGSTLLMWDVATGKQLAVLPEEKNASLRALAFSPDGKFLAAGSYQGNAIRIWDVGAAQVVRTLEGNPISAQIAFDPQGHLLVSEADDLRIWNLPAGEEIGSIAGVAGGSIVFSPDHNWLASNPQGHLKMWDAKTWTARDILPAPSGVFSSLAFAETPLPAGLAESGIRSWPTADAQPAPSLFAFMYAMALSPDKNLLAIGHPRGGDVDVWDLRSATKVISLSPSQITVNRVEFSPDGKLLLSAGQESPITPEMIASHQLNIQTAVKLWDVATWKPLMSVSLSGFGCGVGDFSPDSRFLSFHRSGLIEIFEIANRRLVKRLAMGEYPTGNMAFSPDGTWFASYTRQGVYAWMLNHDGSVKSGAN
jgi:WD40 repeat protein